MYKDLSSRKGEERNSTRAVCEELLDVDFAKLMKNMKPHSRISVNPKKGKCKENYLQVHHRKLLKIKKKKKSLNVLGQEREDTLPSKGLQ